MAWTNLSFPFGSILTSSKMTQLDDNLDALANGDAGAPQIQTAAIADNAVTSAKIPENAITSFEILTRGIVAGNIQLNTITASEIAANAIGTSELASGAVDDSHLQTGTDERDWVLARIAGASTGAVGTYAFFEYTTNTAPGGTVSGSSLTYTGAFSRLDGNSSNWLANYNGSSTASGTWRCMGRIAMNIGGSGMDDVDVGATLWLRIS